MADDAALRGRIKELVVQCLFLDVDPATIDDSANLMETLKPAQITAITFYASGHSYRSSVAEVELLGEQ